MKYSLSFILISLGLISSLSAQSACVGPKILPRIASASPVYSAYEAYRSGQTFLALDLARPLAEQGNAEACFLLGFGAENNGSQTASRLRAMDYYYNKAAAAGISEATLRNTLAAWENGSDADKPKAHDELEKLAATSGAACRLLGEAAMRGVPDGKPDRAKAREWWSKAAEKGDVDTYIPLGRILLDAPADSRDEKAGREWLEKASAAGIPEALVVLGDDQDLASKDRHAAMQSYRRGADLSEEACMQRLAACLFQAGQEKEAAEWLKKSADAGCPAACLQLGQRLKNQKEIPAAYHYFLAAARNGVPQAQHETGMILLSGALGEADPVAGAAWLSQAMPAGDPETLYQLALLNETGTGIVINYANAGMLYNAACSRGHAGAAARIARMAYEGIRLRQSNAQAWAYASLAVKRGNDASKALLDEIDKKLSESERADAEKTLVQLSSDASAQQN